jgi:hypothetical protein
VSVSVDKHFHWLTSCRVSTSLCRHIFELHKANDALLFMTILSTDLKALKRRGYNGASLLLVWILFPVADSLVIPH